jgi:hypothetical protein
MYGAVDIMWQWMYMQLRSPVLVCLMCWSEIVLNPVFRYHDVEMLGRPASARGHRQFVV